MPNVTTHSPSPVEPAGRETSPQRARALPLVAVAGARGKSTTIWLLEAMLREGGQSVGVWSSSGVYVRGLRQPGELGPWSRVLSSIGKHQLDVGLQELETSMVTTVGLPERVYPLAAITTLCGNDYECLISPEFLRGAVAQGIVARAVRTDGLLVLNADDHAVLDAAGETQAQVVVFAMHPENPALRKHLAQGESAVWLQDGQVVVGDEETARSIVPIAEAGFTLNGSLTFEVQNLLCATALAVGMDVPDRAIRRAAAAFEPDLARLPGSCNIIRRGGATILIDSAREVWTLRSLVRGIKHQKHRRSLVVAGHFSHLDGEQIVEAGRLLGRLGGVVILHYQAGPETLELLKEGIAQNPVPPLVLTMQSEARAISHAYRMMTEGDLCFIITDNVQEASAFQG